MLIELLFVGLGGFIGCILRYLIVMGSMAIHFSTTFPLGIIVANTLGCFCIGFVGAYVQLKTRLSPHMLGFIFTGVLGGLTTFSTFAYETFTMLQARHFLYAILNITSQVTFGLIAVWLGFRLLTFIIQY